MKFEQLNLAAPIPEGRWRGEGLHRPVPIQERKAILRAAGRARPYWAVPKPRTGK